MATPPYYAVVFTSIRTAFDEPERSTDLPERSAVVDDTSYAAAAVRMAELAQRQPGYLGMDSARERLGITVSYWRELEHVHLWKRQLEHLAVQRRGRAEWYARYTVRVARIEYEYEFPRPERSAA